MKNEFRAPCADCGNTLHFEREGKWVCGECDNNKKPQTLEQKITRLLQREGVREFDLYYAVDSDGEISPYDASICENKIPWTKDCDWAEPNNHVVDAAYVARLEKLVAALPELVDALEVVHSVRFADSQSQELSYVAQEAGGALARLSKLVEEIES